jgi:uncharacterized membrane protein YfcA
MSPAEIVLGLLVGLVAGVLSGLFGVGGGIVMTPGVQTFLGVAPIVALATPLPVIFPTAIAGALRYRAAGELDLRAAGWLIAGGVPAAGLGALATEVVPAEALLLVTAVLLAWQGVGIVRGSDARRADPGGRADVVPTLVIGAAAGFVSGLLGIGGGLVMVPLLAGWLGMPLKRALGTSLAAIVGMVVPGTAVHAALGNIDWAVALALVVSAVPGARLGSRLALGARERTLRLLVGGFLCVVAILYGVEQAVALAD